MESNGTKKQANVAILISDKTGFKPKLKGNEKEGHYILIKEKSNKR